MEMILEQMKRISLSEDPLPLLIEIQTGLISVSNKDVAAVFESNYPLSYIHPLFDLLNSSNKEQISICVKVLSHILTKLNPCVALENLITQYLRGLTHPDEEVRLLILRQLLLCGDSPEATQLLLTHHPLILTLVKSLGDASMEVIKISHQVIVKLCSNCPDATNLIYKGEGLETLKCVAALSDSHRFHVYEVSVKVSLVNETALRVVAASGVLSQLVSEIFGGDILTQLNALELVSQLAVHPEGLRHLKLDGIVAKLSYLLAAAKSDPMAAVLLPGLLKFFGHLGAVHPSVLAEEETGTLREILRVSCDFPPGGTELSLQLIAFETICHVAYTTEGKNALRKFNVEMEHTLKDFSSHIASFPAEMKVRVLEALAKLFHLPVEQQTEDLLCVLETWFEYLSEKSSMGMVFGVARQPFPEILAAALLLMQSLALLPWGLRHMAAEPGLMEWLLDRDTCKDKESREIRYNIIATIYNNNLVSQKVLDEELLKTISLFYNQGPFYVESDLSVTFEREH